MLILPLLDLSSRMTVTREKESIVDFGASTKNLIRSVYMEPTNLKSPVLYTSMVLEL